ncbi:endonuclease/exonuclease/phosphatase family protein [Streptomyces sp. Z26]|uniref:endonuclease/exonuclease/phosphatase family protein n=1 Tax=Streptomyces sp. Z26 TaxID=2500177 RepID=UPI000EF14CB0|nr:endonuclease/exonuclease/phosphatase family protein [Streptomyces sp. Z26]RLL70014.1 endonuclease/exonuclease/phosphatase family protein [Streptomyces sp. Z26]
MPTTHPPHRPHLPRPTRLLVAAALTIALAAVLATVLMDRGGDRDREDGAGQRPSSLTVATWNVCGVRAWGCADTGDRAAKTDVLLRLARDRDVRVLMLQEACADDVAAAVRELGTSWHSTFRPYTHRDASGRETTVRCAAPRSDRAGYAILAASALTRVTHPASAQPEDGLQRGTLCATASRYDVRACTAHLTPRGGDRAHPGWEYRDDQLHTLVAASRGPRVVYGGDLNTPPPGTRNPSTWVWPSDGPYRTARECAQRSAASRAAEATHRSGHKLDYLFTPLPRLGCAVLPTAASDHRALLLRVNPT